MDTHNPFIAEVKSQVLLNKATEERGRQTILYRCKC